MPPEPVVLVMTAEAQDAWVRFRVDLEARRHPGGDLARPAVEAVDGWLSKADVLLARIAGLLHVVDHGPEGIVERATMERAARIVSWALPHALKVFGALGPIPELRDARQVLRRLRAVERDRFTEREVTRDVRLPVDRVRAALDLLRRTNHARPLPMVGNAKAGRPESPSWELHPLALAGQDDPAEGDP